MPIVFYFIFIIISLNFNITPTFIMKLETNFNSFNNINMIQNQINSNFQPTSNAYSMQLVKKSASTLLMPFDSPPLGNQMKQHNLSNNSNINKNQHLTECENKPVSNIHYESDDDEEDFIHVTFDLNDQSTNLFKNLTQDTLERLDELGILSIQIDQEKPIKTKQKTSNQIVTVNSSNEIKQEKINITTPLSANNLSIPSPSPTSPFLVGQSPQKVLINPTLPSSPSSSLPPPQARKRNRKTINELTNHLTSNNPILNHSQNETNSRPDDATIKTENSITNKSTGQTKRKRSNKSNDNSLDSSIHDESNDLKSSQIKPTIGSDIKQVYIIDNKNSTSIGTSSVEQIHSLPTSNINTNTNNNAFIAPYNSNLNNNSEIVNISNVKNVNNMNTNSIVNYSDHNSFKDQSHQQPTPPQQQHHQLQQIQHNQDQNHQLQQKQQFQMMQQNQPQQYHIINSQHQNLQYQQMYNNQQKISQQPSQQYRMPSPMLANILSSNELNNNYSSQVNVSQIKNNNEIYLLNNSNNHNLINSHDNNMVNKDNINENHNNYNNNNDSKQSLNELQLLKSEDYKQIYQMRQMLIANQQQNQLIQPQLQQQQHIQQLQQHQHQQQIHQQQMHQQQIQQQQIQQQQQLQQQQIQQNQQHLQLINQTQSIAQEQPVSTTTSKKRRTPADPSKTRAKRTKVIAPNPPAAPQSATNTNSLIILSSSDKPTDAVQHQVLRLPSGELNKNSDDKSNLSANIDTKIKNYDSFVNQTTLETSSNNMEKFIDFSIANDPNKDKDLTCNTTPNLQDNKNKLELDDNISKISLQVIDPSSLYSNSQSQQSNLIYLNTSTGSNNENVNKIKSLNFVSFKLNNTNSNIGPVSSAYSSSSNPSQSSYVIANKPQNIIFTNNNNNNNYTPNCVSSSSTASSSISCFNNYEFVNTTKSNSPIKELNSNCSIQTNNTLQSNRIDITEEEAKPN